MGRSKKRQAVFHYAHWLARAVFGPDKIGAFVIGRHVFTTHREIPFWLRMHEMVHVRQYRKYGIFGFFVRYLWWMIRYGYDRHPLEVEAREEGERWKRNTVIVGSISR